jgi:hypothetical protein
LPDSASAGGYTYAPAYGYIINPIATPGFTDRRNMLAVSVSEMERTLAAKMTTQRQGTAASGRRANRAIRPGCRGVNASSCHHACRKLMADDAEKLCEPLSVRPRRAIQQQWLVSSGLSRSARGNGRVRFAGNRDTRRYCQCARSCAGARRRLTPDEANSAAAVIELAPR